MGSNEIINIYIPFPCIPCRAPLANQSRPVMHQQHRADHYLQYCFPMRVVMLLLVDVVLLIWMLMQAALQC